MRKHVFYPLLALLLGVCGACFYRRLLLTSVDGLPLPGDPFALAVLALCAVSALLFLLLAFRTKGLQGGALYAMPCTLRALLLLLCGVTLMLSAMLHLKAVFDAYTAGGPLLSYGLEFILVVLSVPAVISTVFLAKDAKAGSGRSHDSLTVLFPVLYGWFWLIDIYRRHSADPVLWHYIFLLLAAIALLAATFARSGFSFGDGKPGLTVFCCLCALFLAPFSLVSYFDLPTLLTTVGLTFYTIATLTALLRDLPMPEFPDPDAGSDSEPELETEVSDHE